MRDAIKGLELPEPEEEFGDFIFRAVEIGGGTPMSEPAVGDSFKGIEVLELPDEFLVDFAGRSGDEDGLGPAPGSSFNMGD